MTKPKLNGLICFVIYMRPVGVSELYFASVSLSKRKRFIISLLLNNYTIRKEEMRAKDVLVYLSV